MVTLIMNETHNLKEEQKQILSKYEQEIVEVPATGWDLEEQKEKVKELAGKTVVFVSPVPYLLKELSILMGKGVGEVLVFHNSNRVKKELPNGKIIQVVSDEGWELV